MISSIACGWADEASADMPGVSADVGGNGRMITCETLVSQPFQPADSGLALRRRQRAIHRRAKSARRSTSTAPAPSATAYRAIDDAFADYPHAIHYALKANSTLAIARLLQSIGSRADANSGGEIQVALRAGFAPAEIVFTGVGKTRDELEFAIANGVGTINAESAGELDRIAAVARAQGREARVALRVNPDIDARSHPNISTGLKTNKFGVPLQEARAIYRERRGLRGPAVRRRPHPHRIADHDGRAAAPRRRGAGVTRPRAARRRRSRWSTWTSEAASASPYEGRPMITAGRVRRGRDAGTAARRAFRSCSSRAVPSSGTPARWSRASSTPSATRTAGSSPCSMRA